MKILTVVGARPQFIKAATVSRAIRHFNSSGNVLINERIIHTGQHYDSKMSDVFFEEMDIPKPDFRLDCGNLNHGAMTGRMLEGLEAIIKEEKPNFVLVYGDTNSTLAGALAASKLRVPVAHVEAGLRSFNMKMPEEVNRILTDRISSCLFCPTQTAVKNLEKEGFPFPAIDKNAQEVTWVGDVMLDATLFYAEKAKRSHSLEQWGLEEKKYALCTIHRAENTDDPGRIRSIFTALAQLNEELPIILPLHPRTRKVLSQTGNAGLVKDFKVVEPLSYLETQRLEMSAKVILTDSGGMQKEAFFHKVPCITLREETEWIETLDFGANLLVGADEFRILKSFQKLGTVSFESDVYGNGRAAEKILKSLHES